ncbi:inner-membrane translocator [Streptomyces achromogenes]|uniref:inner-membrane translocator n=1 Tax=Streptomyces achromogenes TaxID=67255 RepID=UPI00367AF06B
MPGRDGKRPAGERDALTTTGCLLFLMLPADAVAGLLAAVLLMARGLGRTDTGSVPAGPPSAGRVPMGSSGALALAAGVTGGVLLRLGGRGLGAVQLALCCVSACFAPALRP